MASPGALSVGASGATGVSASGVDQAVIRVLNPTGRVLRAKGLGGSNTEFTISAAPAQDGSIYLAGYTFSPTFEGVTTNGDEDAWIARVK